ncbi:hypothetical protein A2962_01535 [Candidatus Woesebacteria bacterium RIFCSPLOWO2_01_FULL_39_61]|uniref:Uncharacterized protein n=1 Tax=Candidatus Woesebacteria bacterium RIFCSPHIGHO2_02_FULL_39_13 TaxID=1802505 RepID=A0A1F7Z4F9_9BACT|nr:MAG: hypothetical protein A2692_01775 [Candidatus Woesebacteria bacterium RIFCSPHIGHO2_01_FULL_39_95]OGM34526.1 MAG: hypothetical protein A3D01_03225 [Candidatus Woesebacteria bacterium RIFCSPHIGHO2_02_FULL_39_13]OGM38793.1 MAG: hypothetical protein A3E13_01120 [Candidatus Woesebacteria bacterium RIFCSPHIGHO2_12_FULL_40_20]OGM65799.1 MAG: hypothetical protein A2962_01535 [Candidatus Woesebacteria bacterium RIFCSPLOWO2_01_FULL_39_61]OGM73872.1 MAG: hypothetical protein A3H19_04380 [Candidatus
MNNLNFLGDTFLLVTKSGIIFFLFIYLVFAVVVVRQVKLMTETLKVGFETPIKTLALVHAIASLFVLVISFFIL